MPTMKKSSPHKEGNIHHRRQNRKDHDLPKSLRISLLTFVILLRILVGYHHHSGQDNYQGGPKTDYHHDKNDFVESKKSLKKKSNDNVVENNRPVKYGGDYEAQRHWMEITLHLPLKEWYYHDLEYWGLDYPPLTAYVSYAYGWMADQLGSLHDDAFDDENVDGEYLGKATKTCANIDEADEICKNDPTTQTADDKTTMQRKGLRILKELVALHTSRYGFEDARGKLFMRLTVLVLDVTIYMSAVWVLAMRLTAGDDTIIANGNIFGLSIRQHRRIWLLLTALTQPAIILIDHGHFQYNTTSLGLALWSFHFMTLDVNPFLRESDNPAARNTSFLGPVIGSIFFSLALNFKQMELYHAPAVFAYLLGRCFRKKRGRSSNENSANNVDQQPSHIIAAVSRFISLGVTVILTFAILWVPFAITIQPPQDLLSFDIKVIYQILRRLFPFKRGLFEGKVANLWCTLSIRPISIRQRIPEDVLPLAALGLTLVFLLPPCFILFGVGRGRGITSTREEHEQNHSEKDIRFLLWGNTSSALAFFLASFQVHEKGILIALAPLSLLALDAPNFVSWFSIVATWTLWPLLNIDRLCEAYFCCMMIFWCTKSIIGLPSSTSKQTRWEVDIFTQWRLFGFIPYLSYFTMVILHVVDFFFSPPPNLPDLIPVLFSVWGCVMLIFSFMVTIWAMFMQTATNGWSSTSTNPLKAQRRANFSLVVGVLCMVYNVAFADSFLIPSISVGLMRLDQWSEKPATEKPAKHSPFCSMHRNDSAEFSIAEDLLERAKVPLQWEIYRAKDSKPVLNLSARDPSALTLAEGECDKTDAMENANEAEIIEQDDDQSWENGQVWKETERELHAMGILLNPENESVARYIYGSDSFSTMTSETILSRAPQLLRLPTDQITDAADFFLSSVCNFTTTIDGDATSTQWTLATLLPVDPSLLTYCANDLYHGFEFLTNMMARGNPNAMLQTIRSQYYLSPIIATQLLRVGIDSGIDEQRVSNALGNASKASKNAVEGIVGDMGKSYREWRRIKDGEGSI